MSAHRFTLPGYRFALSDVDSAVGKWSRAGTYGDKSAKGEGLIFDVDTLSAFINNARDRGCEIAIDQDHKTVFVESTGQPAPSLGFFHGLALFRAGQLLNHWVFDGAAPPESAHYDGAPRDGLYMRLGRVTPLGRDAQQGLANYSGLSLTFDMEGQAEDGTPIGPSLLCVAATSTPFLAGTPIEFSKRLSAPPTPGATTMGIADGNSVTCPECGTLALLRDGGNLSPHNRAYGGNGPCPMSGKPFPQKMSAPGATAMAQFNPGDKAKISDSYPTANARGQEVTIGRSEPWSPTGEEAYWVNDGFTNRWVRAVDLVKMSAAPSGKGAVKMALPGEKVTCPDCGQRIPVARTHMISIHDKPGGSRCPGSDRGADDMPAAMSATPGAARRFNQTGAPMNPEEFAIKCGFAPEDDDAAKLAKAMACMSTMAAPALVDPPAAMAAAPFEGKETPAEEKAEKEAMAALSQSLTARGVAVPAGASRAVLMSLATLSPALPDTAALKAQIKSEIAAEHAAAAEKTEREHLVTMARTAKAPDYEIVALGAIPLTNARQMAAKYAGSGTGAPSHCFASASSQGGPIGGPTTGAARQGDVETLSAVVRQGSKGDKVIEADGKIAEKARALVESKDPVVMSRVDQAAIDKHGAANPFYRILAAQKLAEAEFPHLVPSAR